MDKGIENFVKHELAEGKTKETILSDLLRAGKPIEVINQIFGPDGNLIPLPVAEEKDRPLPIKLLTIVYSGALAFSTVVAVAHVRLYWDSPERFYTMLSIALILFNLSALHDYFNMRKWGVYLLLFNLVLTISLAGYYLNFNSFSDLMGFMGSSLWTTAIAVVTILMGLRYIEDME